MHFGNGDEPNWAPWIASGSSITVPLSLCHVLAHSYAWRLIMVSCGFGPYLHNCKLTNYAKQWPKEDQNQGAMLFVVSLNRCPGVLSTTLMCLLYTYDLGNPQFLNILIFTSVSFVDKSYSYMQHDNNTTTTTHSKHSMKLYPSNKKRPAGSQQKIQHNVTCE